MSDAVDPFRMIAMIAKAAQEAGIEIDRAMRFIQALSMEMTAQNSPKEPERRQ